MDWNTKHFKIALKLYWYLHTLISKSIHHILLRVYLKFLAQKTSWTLNWILGRNSNLKHRWMLTYLVSWPHELNLWQLCYFVEPWPLLYAVWSPADHICKMYICLQIPRALLHVILCQLYMYTHTFYPIYKNSYATDYITAHIYSWNRARLGWESFVGEVKFFLEPEAGLRNH